jgi:hypothetical protein
LGKDVDPFTLHIYAALAEQQPGAGGEALFHWREAGLQCPGPVRMVTNRGAGTPATDRGLADAKFARQRCNRALAPLDESSDLRSWSFLEMTYGVGLPLLLAQASSRMRILLDENYANNIAQTARIRPAECDLQIARHGDAKLHK